MSAGVTTDIRFAAVPYWLLDAKASPRGVQVYAILRRYAANDSDEAYPSRRTLADLAGCSLNTVDRALRELVSLGALTITARFDDAGDRTSNLYLVHLAPPTQGGGPTDGATGSPTDGATGSPIDGDLTRPSMNLTQEELSIAPTGAHETAKDRHDAIVWALVDAMGWDRDEVPKAQWGRLHRAAKDLADIGADPADIPRRARIYQVNFRGAAMTPNAIATNWPDLATPRAAPSQREITAAAKKAEALGAVAAIESSQT